MIKSMGHRRLLVDLWDADWQYGGAEHFIFSLHSKCYSQKTPRGPKSTFSKDCNPKRNTYSWRIMPLT